MEECNCGRIPPCYGGRVFNIYEEAKRVKEEWDKTQELWGAVIDKMRAKLMEGGFFDDTHDKVYGVNKQMCDLGKTMNDPMKPLSVEAIQEIAKALEITRNPKGIIMEKKTKKMTKAEAFEYLKGKRVACDGFNNEDVQRKLFEVGIRWLGGKADVMVAAPFLYINPDGITHGGSFEWFNLHEYEEISADDILSIEIIEEKKEKFVDCSVPCDEIKAVQELLRNSKHLKDKTLVITKDNAAIL